MDEILPGLWHWTTEHRAIGMPVSSYYVEPARVVIDPMVPPEGLDAAFAGRPAPEQVVLTSGHHGRDAAAFAERFGIPIRTSRAGDEHLGGELEVETFAPGEEVAPGVTALELGILAPDEGALHIAGVGPGALALADALHTYGDGVGFFSDGLLGDDPEAIKAGLKGRLRELLDLDFDVLLCAHGDPIAPGGKTALRAFVGAAG